MARVRPAPEPDDALVERIVAERGTVLDLYRVLLHHNGITEGWLRLGTAVSEELDVDHRTRELAVCAVAIATGASYEWHHHRPAGLRRGLTEEQLDALAAGDRTPFDERDRAVLDAVDVIGRDPAAAGPALDALRPWFDDAAMTQLVVVVGYYWMVTRVTLALDISPTPDDVWTPLT